MNLWQVGEGVTRLHKGQRVLPHIAVAMLTGNGSWQEYILLDEEWVWPLPHYITDEQAAQLVINPMTAYAMMREFGEVPKGEYLVQSAAGSTLGRQVIALAKHWGIKLINVVRRAEQKEELKALGADEVINSTDEDVVARVKEITAGKGAWGGLDAVAGTTTQTLASTIRDGGSIFAYGMLSKTAPSITLMDLQRGVQLKGYTLYKELAVRERRDAYAAEVAALIKEGVIGVAEVEKFELRDFRRAIARSEEVPSTTKVMLASA